MMSLDDVKEKLSLEYDLYELMDVLELSSIDLIEELSNYIQSNLEEIVDRIK